MSNRIIIFGASNKGQQAYNALKNNHKIEYFCDNDTDKIGSEISGVTIISIERVIDIILQKDIDIVIASVYSKEIQMQLFELGVNKERIKIWDCYLRDIVFDMENYSRITTLIDKAYRDNLEFNIHLMYDNFYNNSFIRENNKTNCRNNNYYIILESRDNLKYINEDSTNMIYIDISRKINITELILLIKLCKKIFFHYLSDEICDLLFDFNLYEYIEESYWMVWGGDLYYYIDYELFDSKTQSLGYINKKLYLSEARKKTIESMKYILSFSKYDYNLIRENFVTNASFCEFCYSLNIDIQELIVIKEDDNDSCKRKLKCKKLVLIGNSAFPSNNHIDIMDRLSKFHNSDIGIICPLSYGDINYRNKVIDYGNKLFGEKFLPLSEYLDKKEYYSLMNEVDVVIMNHTRQQGIGNSVAALLLEKKVYMNVKSSVYDFYIDNGIKIFENDEIDRNNFFDFDDNILIANSIKIQQIFNDERIKNIQLKTIE